MHGQALGLTCGRRATGGARRVRSVSAPTPKPIGQQLSGALAQMWGNGHGPSHSAIDSCLAVVGLTPEDFSGTKEAKVRRALAGADDQMAIDLATELVDLLRAEGVFEVDNDLASRRISRLQDIFAGLGATLSNRGALSWSNVDQPRAFSPAPNEPSSPSSPGATAGAAPGSAAPQPPPGLGHGRSGEATGPTLAFLVQVLRRVPEASRPLVGTRRKGKVSVPVVDEYDAQDFVFQALRLLYADTREEEWMPSFAGAASRTDFFVKAESTAVEVKVTRAGRAEKVIRDEIVVDQRAYKTHPKVQHLVVVVYDLVNNFANPAGFEDDLSGVTDGLMSTVLVVPWPQFP